MSCCHYARPDDKGVRVGRILWAEPEAENSLRHFVLEGFVLADMARYAMRPSGSMGLNLLLQSLEEGLDVFIMALVVGPGTNSL